MEHRARAIKTDKLTTRLTIIDNDVFGSSLFPWRRHMHTTALDLQSTTNNVDIKTCIDYVLNLLYTHYNEHWNAVLCCILCKI